MRRARKFPLIRPTVGSSAALRIYHSPARSPAVQTPRRGHAVAPLRRPVVISGRPVLTTDICVHATEPWMNHHAHSVHERSSRPRRFDGPDIYMASPFPGHLAPPLPTPHLFRPPPARDQTHVICRGDNTHAGASPRPPAIAISYVWSDNPASRIRSGIAPRQRSTSSCRSSICLATASTSSGPSACSMIRANAAVRCAPTCNAPPASA